MTNHFYGYRTTENGTEIVVALRRIQVQEIESYTELESWDELADELQFPVGTVFGVRYYQGIITILATDAENTIRKLKAAGYEPTESLQEAYLRGRTMRGLAGGRAYQRAKSKMLQ